MRVSENGVYFTHGNLIPDHIAMWGIYMWAQSWEGLYRGIYPIMAIGKMMIDHWIEGYIPYILRQSQRDSAWKIGTWAARNCINIYIYIYIYYIYNYIVPWFRGKSPSREALLRKIEGREIGHARYTPKKQNTPWFSYSHWPLSMVKMPGWWFGTFGLFFHSVGNVIIPTDFHLPSGELT